MRPDTVTHTELYLIFQVNPKKTKRDLEVKQAKFAEAKVSLEDVTEELNNIQCSEIFILRNENIHSVT